MPASPVLRRSSPLPRRRLAPGRTPVAVALSSLALLGALPTAAHAAGWVAGPRFGVPAGSVGGDFVAAPDGSSTASWFGSRDGAPPVLHVQHARPDGTVDAPLRLGAGAFPAMATSTTNLTAVAWIGGTTTDDDQAVRVSMLDADGARTRTTTVATLTAEQAGASPSAAVALDAAGNATVAWTRVDPDTDAVELDAASVSSVGNASAPVTLGETTLAPGARPVVAAAPDGTAWVGWITPDAGVEVARLNGAGAVDVPATQVSAGGDRASGFELAGSAGGAAVAWVVADPDGEIDPSGFPLSRLAGVRLTARGSLVGAPFRATGAVDLALGGFADFGRGVGLGIGPDGTVSLGWTRAGNELRGLTAVLSRFGPGQTTVPGTQLSAENGVGTLSPRIGAAADGSLVTSWLRLNGVDASVGGARVAPDGTIGTAASTVASAALDPGFLPPELFANADDHGAGTIGVGTTFRAEDVDWSFSAFRFDVVGPTVTVDVPATATALSPVRFTGTVGDPESARLRWEFGDGGTTTGLSVNHVFAGPGTYTVTARATDDVANETVVTREITVTAAPTGGPGGGATSPPPVVPGPVPAPAATAAAAALKVTKATRRGTKVTVSGTISSRATGKLTVSYAQRVGRSTVSVKRQAIVSKGRWRTTLTLPRSLAKGKAAKRKGTVTASFAGTAAVKRATAKRTVSLARAKKARTATG